MASTTVKVGSAVGLHARPASLIAEKAGELDAEVTLALAGSDEEPVDASSALLIMTLGAEFGSEVVVSSDDEGAMQEIAAMVAKDLDSE